MRICLYLEELWHCGMMHSWSYEDLVPWKHLVPWKYQKRFNDAKLTGISDVKVGAGTKKRTITASSTISKCDDDLCTCLPLNLALSSPCIAVSSPGILIVWRLAIRAGRKLGSWQQMDLRGICGRDKVTLKNWTIRLICTDDWPVWHRLLSISLNYECHGS